MKCGSCHVCIAMIVMHCWMNKYLFITLVLFSSVSFSSELNCGKAITTIDINQCASIELQAVENEMQRYFTKSIEQHQHDKELTKSIEDAQKAWHNYINSHCELFIQCGGMGQFEA